MAKFFKALQVVVVMGLSIVLIQSAEARDLKASLGHIPMMAESPEKGMLVELVKAMDEIYTEGKITIDVYPCKRAIDNVVNGTHDFYVPLLKPDNVNEEEMPFNYSSGIFDSIFVLYTNKNNTEINPGNVEKFKIETEAPAVSYFDFPIRPSNSVESSLKKLDIGRIDGYIFAMAETDFLLQKLDLKNIKRSYYKTYPAKIIVKKGPKGEEVDAIISSLIDKLKQNGTFVKIFGPVLNQKFAELK